MSGYNYNRSNQYGYGSYGSNSNNRNNYNQSAGGGGYRQQPQQSAYRAAPQQVAAPASSNRRQTVGTITKIHDKFCFIDQDIFCQLSLFRAPHKPCVGDRYHVEAEYNPQMPFKWNAIRVAPYVQSKPAAPPAVAPRSSNRGSSHSSRSDSNRTDTSRGGSGRSYDSRNDRKRDSSGYHSSKPVATSSSHGASSGRSGSNSRHESASKTAPAPRHGQAAASSYDSGRGAKQVNLLQFPVGSAATLDVAEVNRRYRSKIFCPSFFVNAHNKAWEAFENCNVLHHVSPDDSLNVYPSRDEDEFNAFKAGEELTDEDNNFQARVLICGGPGQEKLLEQAGKNDPKSKSCIARTNKNLLRCVGAVVDYRNSQYYLPGGDWSPSADGEDTSDPQTLINTAIRTVKKSLGIDLSGCKHWYRFLEVHYKRDVVGAEAAVAGQTAIFVPSIGDIMPTDEEWTATVAKYTESMEKALAKPEEDQKVAQVESDEKFKKEQAEKKAKKAEEKQKRKEEAAAAREKRRQERAEAKVARIKAAEEAKIKKAEEAAAKKKAEAEAKKAADEAAAETAAEENTEEEVEAEAEPAEEKMDDDDAADGSEEPAEADEADDPADAADNSAFLAIEDVTKLKVAELKDFLEKAGLETKGKKAQLVERLQDYVDSLKDGGNPEEAGDAEAEEPEAVDDKMEDDEKKEENEDAEAKDEDAMEDEESEDEEEEEEEEDDDDIEELPPQVKVVELTAREKSDIKRRYDLPKERSIIAHFTASRQIRVVNLQSLLNVTVRKGDNYVESDRERIFETQLIIEVLAEMMQRQFTKDIYYGLIRYAERMRIKREQEEADRKKREEEKKAAAEAKKKAEEEAKAKAEADKKAAEEKAAKEKEEAEQKKAEEEAKKAEEEAKAEAATEEEEEVIEDEEEKDEEVAEEEEAKEDAEKEEAEEVMEDEEEAADAAEPAAKKAKTDDEATEEEAEPVEETAEEKKAKAEEAKKAAAEAKKAAAAKKAEEEAQKKAEAEEAAKKAEEERKEAERKKEAERPKYRYDLSLLMAFGFFDDAYQGQIRRSDLIDILSYGGLGVSLQEIHHLIRKCSIGDSNLSYTKLFSDLPIEWDWNRPDLTLTRTANRTDISVVSDFDDEAVREALDAQKQVNNDALGKVVAFKDELDRVRAKLARAEDDRDKNATALKDQGDKLKTIQKDLSDQKKQTAAKAGEAKREHAKVAGLQAQIKALEDQIAGPVDDEIAED